MLYVNTNSRREQNCRNYSSLGTISVAVLCAIRWFVQCKWGRDERQFLSKVCCLYWSIYPLNLQFAIFFIWVPTSGFSVISRYPSWFKDLDVWCLWEQKQLASRMLQLECGYDLSELSLNDNISPQSYHWSKRSPSGSTKLFNHPSWSPSSKEQPSRLHYLQYPTQTVSTSHQLIMSSTNSIVVVAVVHCTRHSKRNQNHPPTLMKKTTFQIQKT